jgi:hypothetical protein
LSNGVQGARSSKRHNHGTWHLYEELRYLDGVRHTPLTDVIQNHQPDLILLPSAVQFDSQKHGYRLRKKFDLQNPYTLYDRPAAGHDP